MITYCLKENNFFKYYIPFFELFIYALKRLSRCLLCLSTHLSIYYAISSNVSTHAQITAKKKLWCWIWAQDHYTPKCAIYHQSILNSSKHHKQFIFKSLVNLRVNCTFLGHNRNRIIKASSNLTDPSTMSWIEYIILPFARCFAPLYFLKVLMKEFKLH